MAYLVLAVAILSEVLGTVSLKLAEGFTKPLPSIVVVVGYGSAFIALAAVLKMGVPVGVAYAVWAGAGVALVAIIGAAFLGENVTPIQVGGMALIIGGVVAIELGGTH
jgi:small multidrug resistance pump